MTLYLRAGVARVQSYLARTPQLALVRGASTALRHDRLAAAAVTAGFTPAPSALEVDAVITVSTESNDPPEVLATRLATALSASVPAAEMRVSWAYDDADMTGSAHPRMDAALGKLLVLDRATPGSNPMEILPALNELPPLQSCETCRLDSATTTITMRRSGRVHVSSVCNDCSKRWEIGSPTGRQAEEPRPSETPVRTFDDLAALDEAPGGNHLATIHIDANQLGSIFEHLADCGEYSGMTTLSADVKEAVLAGLAAGCFAAASALGMEPERDTPVLTHIRGGDDLLVSVPARAAWPFASECIRVTTERARAAVPSRIGGPQPGDGPMGVSVSAGICFADAHYPFSATADLAYSALRRAKNVVMGGECSITWVNVTVDGPSLPVGRAVLPESCVSETPPGRAGRLRHAIAEIGQLPSSTRRSLARSYRLEGWDSCRAEGERLHPTKLSLFEPTERHAAEQLGLNPDEIDLLARSWWI